MDRFTNQSNDLNDVYQYKIKMNCYCIDWFYLWWLDQTTGHRLKWTQWFLYAPYFTFEVSGHVFLVLFGFFRYFSQLYVSIYIVLFPGVNKTSVMVIICWLKFVNYGKLFSRIQRWEQYYFKLSANYNMVRVGVLFWREKCAGVRIVRV